MNSVNAWVVCLDWWFSYPKQALMTPISLGDLPSKFTHLNHQPAIHWIDVFDKPVTCWTWEWWASDLLFEDCLSGLGGWKNWCFNNGSNNGNSGFAWASSPWWPCVPRAPLSWHNEDIISEQSSEEWWKEDALRVCNFTVLLFKHVVDVLCGMLWGKSCRYLKTQYNLFLKFIAVRRLGIMQTNEHD